MPFSFFKKKPPATEVVQEPIQGCAPDDAAKYARKYGQRKANLAARPPTPAQIKSTDNKKRTLGLLGRFGIVDTPFTALGAFKGYSQAYEMSRRTLIQLHKEKSIAIRKGVHGSSVYVLTEKGAELASRILYRDVQNGMHLRTPTSPTLLHRLLGSYYLLHYVHVMRQRHINIEYFTERELEQYNGRRQIDDKSIIGKRRPDSLVIELDRSHRYATWVEVERGYKTYKRFEDQLIALLYMFDNNIAPTTMPDLILKEIHYVADPNVIDLIRLAASIRNVLDSNNFSHLLDRITVFRASIKRPYVVDSLSGLRVTDIPEIAPEAGLLDTPERALEQEFDCGFVIWSFAIIDPAQLPPVSE